MSIKKYIMLLIMFSAFNVYAGSALFITAQQDTTDPADTTLPADTSSLSSDSLFISDTTGVSDSLQAADSLQGDSGIDSIFYATSTDSLIFFVKDKRMEVYGNGDMLHEQTQLKSGAIHVNFETNIVEAYGFQPDTVGGKMSQTPVLVDKGEEYFGVRMTYNYRTSKGFITYAESEAMDASYLGTKIKKMDQNTYFVQDGFYTTCEADFPHYGFYCYQMKVIPEEQVVGRWIWLTFGGVPFPVPVPFAVFPIEKGRRSGIIIPAYGSSQSWGRYFQRGGYFWAINDYMDLTLTGDYYTRGGWGAAGRFRYNKRYNYTGSLEGNYRYTVTGESTDKDRTESDLWQLRFNHNQTISPSSSLIANLDFTSSSEYYNQTTTDFDKLLTQTSRSNATYSKRWDDAGISLTANYNRVHDLNSGDITEELPNISVNVSQFYPFKSTTGYGGENWYDKIGMNYRGQFKNTRKTEAGELDVRGAVLHTMGVSASTKLGYISLTPNINYEERWYNKYIEKKTTASYDNKDSIYNVDKYGINMVRTFSVGVGAQTKLYGMFNTNSLGIEAFRHTIIPNVSYSYNPDFSEDMWGYYDTYVNGEGERVEYNRFEDEHSGRISATESQSINFSVSNILEMKTLADPTDTTAKAEKINILNAGISSRYNFAADSMKLSDFSVNFRTQINPFLNLSGSSRFTPYDFDTASGNHYNRFLFQEGKGILRRTSFSFTVNTNLTAALFQSQEEEEPEEGEEGWEEGEEESEVFFGGGDTYYRNIYADKEPDFDLPWSVNLNYTYGVQSPKPGDHNVSSTLGASFSFNISQYWKFTVNGNYDFVRKEFATPRITINRDLHCWLMNFSWTPVGPWTGYRLEIRVKASHLQDLKLLKSDGFSSGRN